LADVTICPRLLPPKYRLAWPRGTPGNDESSYAGVPDPSASATVTPQVPAVEPFAALCSEYAVLGRHHLERLVDRRFRSFFVGQNAW
jgi:hypothetical protein